MIFNPAEALKQPHILTAGTTGAGKSVVMKKLIEAAATRPASEIYLIDPKRVEFSPYYNRAAGYSKTAPGAALLLSECCARMDARYKTLEKAGLTEWRNGDIYIFVDELADLLIVPEKKQAQEIARYLSRLAQLGRAAHIHLIVATQFVRRQTLPLALVANIPAVIGLRTRDKLESRLLIGRAGCEALPKHGEGYYISPDYLTPQKIQIPL